MVRWTFFFQAIVVVQILSVGALAVILSSDPEVNATTVCPSTNVTFTCFVEQTSSMGWDVGGMEMKSFLSTDVDDIGRLFVVDNVFMVTLISISSVSNGLADLTTTLMVTADEVENGTAITCRSFSDMQSISLVIASPPPAPSNVVVETEEFQTDHFSIKLSWDSQNTALVDTYRISINDTAEFVEMDTTMHILEGKYNNNLTINISAVNCAGRSEGVVMEVYEAGCLAPTAPDNGSVSNFTSARAGASVTYLCDTGLELVGGSIATCSLTSLQWEPSIMCISPGSGDPPVTTSSKTTVSSNTTSPTLTVIPTVTPTVTSSSSGEQNLAFIAAPVVVIAVIIITLTAIVLAVLIYRHRSNRGKKLRGADNNEYNVGQELLSVRPDSSTSGTLPSSPRSPSESSPGPMYDAVTTSNPAGPMYDAVTTTNRAGPMYDAVTPDSPVRPAPGSVFTNHAQNGSSGDRRAPPQHYSQPDNQTSHAQAATSSAGPRDDGRGNRNPPLMYAELGFTDSKMQAPLNLTESGAVLYSEVGGNVPHSSHDPSTPTRPPKSSSKPSTKPHPPEPYGSSKPAHSREMEKHPLDKQISIDAVIQQLEELVPHWQAVGEAAHIQPEVMSEVAMHFKNNDQDAFVEVINQWYRHSMTTWKDVAGLCEKAGFTDVGDSLLDAYRTGILPVQVEDVAIPLSPPSQPAPPVPPRSMQDSQDRECTPPPALPPPLALTDIPDLAPPPHRGHHSEAVPDAPPRPPKPSSSRPAKPPRRH